jgi:hypothetical protein
MWCASRAAPTARVAGGRLDPDVVEDAGRSQLAVGHAVQRHAARQHEPALPAQAAQVARRPEHDLLRHLLDTGREVHLAPRDRCLGLARRAVEQVGEARTRHRHPVQPAEVSHIQTV